MQRVVPGSVSFGAILTLGLQGKRTINNFFLGHTGQPLNWGPISNLMAMNLGNSNGNALTWTSGSVILLATVEWTGCWRALGLLCQPSINGRSCFRRDVSYMVSRGYLEIPLHSIISPPEQDCRIQARYGCRLYSWDH